jgi:S-methylmethionine-dependent homocysteine/selenocysteine methylase
VRVLLIKRTPASIIDITYTKLRENAPQLLRTGLYANIGHVDEIKGWSNTQNISSEGYAALAQICLNLGASLIGGCCGTNPEYILELAKLLKSTQYA